MKKTIKTVFIGCMLAVLAFSAIPPTFSSAATSTVDDIDFAVPIVSKTSVPDGYVGIYTATDLDNIRNNLSGKYILMNDIVFSESDFQEGGAFYNDGKGWVGIGSYHTWTYFSGTLDGNGYKIAGLTCRSLPSKTDSDIMFGLFELSFGTIKNLEMSDVSIVTDEYCWSAPIVVVNMGQIYNCMTFGVVDQSDYIPTDLDNYEAAGGISAQNGEDGTISFSKNYCSVTTCNHSGGIVASNQGTIKYCANFGQITTIKRDLDCGPTGGIASENGGEYDTIISQCYNAGPIIGASFAGGIVGSSYAVTTSVIVDCFNTGLVKTTLASDNDWQESVGGIICWNGVGSSIKNCYSTGLLICAGTDPILGGISGYYGRFNHAAYTPGTVNNAYYLDVTGNNGVGTKLSYSEMASKSSYVGFDFSNVWVMSPTLKRPVLQGLLPDTDDISYELNGGRLSSSAPTAYMDGSNRLLPTPVKDGYSFLGWFNNASLDGKAIRQIPDGTSGTVQYYAKWGAATENVQQPQNNTDDNPDTGDMDGSGMLLATMLISLMICIMLGRKNDVQNKL